jgi:hypothetical protein
MKKRSVTLISILLILFLNGCNLQSAATPGGTTSDIVGTKVAMTLTAFTQTTKQAPLASQTPDQPTNTVEVVLSPSSTPTVASTPTMTLTPETTNTPIPKPGSIEGGISGYPYGSLPKLTIVAFGQEAPYNYSYLITSAGDTSYSMSSSYLLPGKYQVVAYDSSNRTGGCPVIITVISDQTVTCNITHWGGGYPSRPSGVPGP